MVLLCLALVILVLSISAAADTSVNGTLEDHSSRIYTIDVSDTDLVLIDTSGGNVIIGGFTGGIRGQRLDLSVINATGNTTLEHNESTGNQDVFLASGGDETKTAGHGGWRLVCDGSNWFEVD